MGSFWVPKPLIWEAWWLHLGTLGGHLGDPGVPGHTPRDTWGSISGFSSIFDGFRVPLGSHFGLILVTFSLLWTLKCQSWFRGGFLSDLGVEIAREPDIGMCLNYSKY